jgi:hypothetical protein
MRNTFITLAACLGLVIFVTGCKEKPGTQGVEGEKAVQGSTAELTDAQVENIVKRSYQYVAMYNVNNKFALSPGGGWNTCVATPG